MWDPIRSKQEEEPESVLSESDLGRWEGRCWRAGLKLCLDGGHLETSSGPRTPHSSKMTRRSREPGLGELESCWCVAW